MKDILSLWLCHLLLLDLKHITICHAVELSELQELARNYYEEPNSYSRRAYGGTDNVNRASKYYEAAYTDDARRANQQDSSGKIVSETKFTKPANLRKHHSAMRSAYDTALGYGNTRNGDINEIELAVNVASSAEKDVSNSSIGLEGGVANNTAFSSSSIFSKSNFGKQSGSSCNCEGSGANEEVNFLCFSSKDGGKNLSIKYKGTTMFKLEDILKAYKFYYDNMQVHDINFENTLNGDSNFKNEFEGDTKFNFDLSTYKINEGNFDLNSESKFDINEIKKGASKFDLNTFDKFDMKTTKEGSNQFNFDFTKNTGQDIQKYFKDNNKFNTQYENNVNSNYNLETNAKIEAWKKVQDMAESKKKSYNFNQFSFDSDVQADAQAEFEAHAKALSQAKAIAKAQAILQAQAEAQAEAKAQAVLQSQIIAQAQAEAHAQAMAEAQAQADSQFSVQSQSQAQAHAQAQAKAQAHAQAQAQAQAQSHAQAQAQAQSHAQAQAQAQAHAKAQGQAYSQTQSAFSSSDADNNGFLSNGVQVGVGGLKNIFGKGLGLGFGGVFGGSKHGTSYGKQSGGGFGFGTGGSGGISFGSHGAHSEKSYLGSNDGLGIGASMTYTGGDINYADALYDENSEDGYVSTGYPGVLAYPAPNNSPILGSRYNDGYYQKHGFAFGVPGYP